MTGRGVCVEGANRPADRSARLTGYLHTAVQSLVQALEEAPQSAGAERCRSCPDSERQRWSSDSMRRVRRYPRQELMHELFEGQVERTADALAVVFEDQSLTYAQLNTRANRLARYLIDAGVGSTVWWRCAWSAAWRWWSGCWGF